MDNNMTEEIQAQTIGSRSGKELILATKIFAKEIRWRSWAETYLTLILTALAVFVTLSNAPIAIRLLTSVVTGLLYVRLFVIYHDYQHHAILQKSWWADLMMKGIGVYLLAPQNIWKRSHDYHHNNNAKLSMNGIGSYPTITKERFLNLTSKERLIYLTNRHPFTVIFGYFTLFVYWLNVKSFVQSPMKHLDSLFALIVHVVGAWAVWYYLGGMTFLIAWFIPFFIAFGLGSYLFYCQHNFPGAEFKENHDWTYDNAALSSTSFMVMHPVMHWFTGDIGFHHVHHMNSRIPFYRLKETMESMPELQKVVTTTLHPKDVLACFNLKVWDPEQNRMLTMREVYSQ
jgi:acyl-lipid omega-6 desaturase (Delta-12 desaturase)